MGSQGPSDDHGGLAEERTELAEERTDWALERTLLANERTFSAWVRTGVAAVAAGLGIAKLLESLLWPWAVKVNGALFVLGGAAAFLIAIWRYAQVYHGLKLEGLRVTPIWPLGVLVGFLLVTAVMAFLLLFEA